MHASYNHVRKDYHVALPKENLWLATRLYIDARYCFIAYVDRA